MRVEEQLQGLRGYVDEVQRTITVAEVLQARASGGAAGPSSEAPAELPAEPVYAAERPFRRGRLAVAAAVLALLGVGVALLVRAAAPSPLEPAGPTTTVESASAPAPRLLVRGTDLVEEIEPGTYALDADGLLGGERFVFDVPAGWRSWGGGVVQGDPAVAGMSFGEIWNLHGDPCRNSLGLLSPAPGPSVDELVAALVAMPGFLVTGAPEPVTVDGYQGTYLELTVDPDLDFSTCDDGSVFSWVGPLVERFHQAPGQVEQFWVLDVEGERVVLGAMHLPDASADVLDQLAAVVDSVRIDVVP